ncbi:MAG: glycosyltransferase [Cellulosilyticaceae bacterium]
MNKKIVVFSRFNSDIALSKSFNVDSTSREWIERRIGIFNKYTRVSLENQTNQNFLAVLTTLPESMTIIQETLEKYKPLSNNIVFTPEKDKVIEAYIKDADVVYIVHIDSDDMYAIDFIEKLQNYTPNSYTGVLVCQKGYLLNDTDFMVATYFNKAPAVFTEIFKVKDYLEMYQNYPTIGHASIIYAGHEVLDERTFITTIHGENTWQQLGPEFYNAVIKNDEERKKILKDFRLIQD